MRAAAGAACASGPWETAAIAPCRRGRSRGAASSCTLEHVAREPRIQAASREPSEARVAPELDPYRKHAADLPQLNTGVAVDCAARAAKRFWLSDKAFRASLTEVRVEELGWTRALHAIVRGERPLRRDVRFDPPSTRAMHPGLERPESFDAPNVSLPGELVEDKAALLASLPPELHPELSSDERVESTRVQRFVSSVVRVGYATARGRGSIDIAAHDSSVLSSSDLGPLAARRWTTLGTAGILSSLWLVVFFAFFSLRPWVAGPGQFSLVIALGLLLTGGSFVAAQELTLSPGARQGQRGFVGVALAIGSLAVLTFSWVGTRPSVAHAESTLLAGRDADAELEARALVAAEQDKQAGQAILDEAHLHRLKAAASLDEKARVAALDWFSPKARELGLETLRESTRAAADAAFPRRSRGELERLAQATSLDAESHDYPLALRALLDVEDCTKRDDVDCALRVLSQQAPAAGRDHRSRVHQVIVDAMKRVLDAELQRRLDANTKEERKRSWARSIWLAHQLEDLGAPVAAPSLDELEVGYDQQLYTNQGEQAQREMSENIAERVRESHQESIERAHQAAVESMREWEAQVLGKAK